MIRSAVISSKWGYRDRNDRLRVKLMVSIKNKNLGSQGFKKDDQIKRRLDRKHKNQAP